MTAPTEAEIREAAQDALRAVIEEHGGGWDVPWVYDLCTPIRYAPDDGPMLDTSPWTDLRPSQAARLDALVDGIYETADKLMAETAARVAEAVVEAALTFAAEYPDAPRAKATVAA